MYAKTGAGGTRVPDAGNATPGAASTPSEHAVHALAINGVYVVPLRRAAVCIPLEDH